MKFNLITILGPTATGKTKLAAEIAYHYNGEIISADSRQVYKGMDIGTGKDISDYTINGKQIPYHLIDIIEPDKDYCVYDFQTQFYEKISQIKNLRKLPILCGGTNLYIHSVLKSYQLGEVNFDSDEFQFLMEQNEDELKDILLRENENLHNTTDLNDKIRIAKAIIISRSKSKEIIRPKINSLNICIDLPRNEIKKRITKRLKERLANGMIDEVKNLIANKNISYERLAYFGLEYKFIGLYLEGKLNYNDMYQKLNSAIHQFAKKQVTWIRKMEREGLLLHKINGNDFNKAKEIIDAELY